MMARIGVMRAFEPERRPGVQPRSQSDALGKAEAEEGCMTDSKDRISIGSKQARRAVSPWMTRVGP
jgi:hypothetical protein